MNASAFIFYVSNLGIVSGYLFASIMITLRKGAARDMSTRAWVAGLAFFLLCGLTHVELAFHAALGVRIIGPEGGVGWHMHLVHIPQAVSIWAFLWAMQGGPLEAAATLPKPGVPR